MAGKCLPVICKNYNYKQQNKEDLEIGYSFCLIVESVTISNKEDIEMGYSSCLNIKTVTASNGPKKYL